MAEIPQIISAIAAVITAFGGVVFAASKLGPVLNAVNKMLTDQHKRAMEAKKSATIQSPRSTTLSTDGLSGGPWPLRPGKERLAAGIILSFSIILMMLQMFPPGGVATSQNVVVCATSATTIIIFTISAVTDVILHAILAMILSQSKDGMAPGSSS